MKRKLSIVFMGTPDFAVATLKEILEQQYDVVGVITAPDRPAGRGRKLRMSAVKEFALENGLKVLQPTNLKDESFLAELKALQANVQVVVAFRMLPAVVWQMPEYGTFNLHASLLPQYRGAAPINWAIINGENRTGVTTFFIDEKIDTGAIILNKETDIDPEEDAGSLHDRLMTLGAGLVTDTLKLLEEGKVATKAQPEADTLKKAYKLNKDNCKIDWDQPAAVIYNLVRGLSPYPGAWCTLIEGEREAAIKIYKTHKANLERSEAPGTLISEGKQLFVAASDGWLELEEVQLPGKRKMAVSDLLNGWTPEAGSRLG